MKNIEQIEFYCKYNLVSGKAAIHLRTMMVQAVEYPEYCNLVLC